MFEASHCPLNSCVLWRKKHTNVVLDTVLHICSFLLSSMLLSFRAGLVIGHTEHFPGGPTHWRGRQNVFFFFFFFAITQGQRAASGPFSCIDSVIHPITMRYRRSDEVFCSAYKDRFFFFYQEQACSAVNDAAKEPGRRRREVESVKCLIGTRDGVRHLTTYPNVCACHKCRLRKHFLIKRKFAPRDFFFCQGKSSVFIEVSMGQCELI